MTRKPPSPLFIGVVCGMGTLIAFSVVAMVLAPGLPQALYDFGAISRAINVGNWLPPMFALVSLFGYLESGFLYMLLKRRQATPSSTAPITLIDVEGQEQPTAGRPPAASGAIAGILSALFGLGLAIPILVVLTYVTLQDRDINMPAALMTQVLVGSGIMGVVNLLTGMVLGAVLGAIGGLAGGMLPQTPAVSQVS